MAERSRGGLVIGGVVLAVACLGAAIALNTPTSRSGPGARVVVPSDATLATVAESLRKARVIRSSQLFRLYATITGRSGTAFTAGRYLIARGSGMGAILDQVRDGTNRVRRLTIPEGWSIQQIARLTRDSLGIAPESLLTVTRDSARRARMGTPARDVEGYLFPATYEFAEGANAQDVVDSMLVTFDRRWKATWDTALTRDGRTRHAVVTLASIVEKEARRDDERAQIAAVYSNRLKAGMRLQADPTVLYALGVVAKRVLFADLKHESPYNTYRVAGLPPGPIASPGTASLAAAVAPANSDAMFFVAFPDGHHEFRKTFAEHSAVVARAHAARDSSNAAR